MASLVIALVSTPASSIASCLIIMVVLAAIAVVVVAPTPAPLTATSSALALVMACAPGVSLLIALLAVVVVLISTIVAVGVATALTRRRRRLGSIGNRRLKSSLRLCFASLMDFGEVDRGLIASLASVLRLVIGICCAVHHGLPVDFFALGGPVIAGGWGLGCGRGLRLGCGLLARLINRFALVGFLVGFLSHLLVSKCLKLSCADGACRVLLPF